MKLHTLLILLVALLAGTARAQTNDTIEKFKKDWAAAEKVNDRSAMERLMRRQQDEAVYLVMDTAEAIQGRPSEELFNRLTALRVAWREVHKTEFVTEMERFFSFLDAATNRVRGALLQNYYQVHPRILKALEEDDLDMIAPMAVQVEQMAMRFEEIGDKFNASNAWYIYGETWIEGHRPTGSVDMERAAYGYKKAVDLRREIGLEDNLFRSTEAYLKRLAEEGVEATPPPSGGGPEASATEPASAVKVTGTPVRATLEFEMVEELDRYERPNYNLDPFHGMWYPAYLAGRGSTIAIGRLPEKPQFVRTGSSEIRVDVDTDGEPDQDLDMSGRLSPLVFQLGEGPEARSYGLLTMPGIEQDFYQGLQVNLAATDNLFPLYLIAGASMVGDLAGTEVRIIDEDLDGVFGGPHTSWANVGLSEGVYQPEFDSILIGRSKRALPWSQYQEIDGQWYRLEVGAGGKTLEATPVEVPTGTLQLSFDGPRPHYLVVQGEGEFERTFFDLADGKVEVPVGRYGLYVGEIRKGKKLQAMKTLVLPGPGTPRWTVEAGKTTEVVLGEPFGFDFDFTVSGGKLVVDGHSVVITGSQGERYERPWNCVPQPEVSYREPGASRGIKGDEMGLVDNLIDGRYQYRDAWSPLTLEVEMRGVEGAAEVQLAEKKNKLFGKIESEWKGQ